MLFVVSAKLSSLRDRRKVSRKGKEKKRRKRNKEQGTRNRNKEQEKKKTLFKKILEV